MGGGAIWRLHAQYLSNSPPPPLPWKISLAAHVTWFLSLVIFIQKPLSHNNINNFLK